VIDPCAYFVGMAGEHAACSERARRAAAAWAAATFGAWSGWASWAGPVGGRRALATRRRWVGMGVSYRTNYAFCRMIVSEVRQLPSMSGGYTMFKRVVHPGAVLKDELDELGISPTEFARPNGHCTPRNDPWLTHRSMILGTNL
jgi:hypothetical protein